jgi:hypothetical protein
MVAWSAFEGPEIYHTDVGGSGDGSNGEGYTELADTPGEIMAVAPFLNYLVILKTDAVVLMVPTKNIDDPFQFEWIIKGRGTPFQTYCSRPDGLGIVTDDDIVLFNGTPNLQSIADRRIRRKFFDTLDGTKAEMVHSVYNPSRKEWRIYVPLVGQSTPQACWIFNFRNGEWTYDEGQEITGVGLYRYSDPTTYAGLSGDGTTWADLISEGSTYGDFLNIDVQKSVLHGDSTGYTYVERISLKTEDGDDISSQAVTQENVGTDFDVIERWTELILHFLQSGSTDDTITVAIEIDNGGYQDTTMFAQGVAVQRDVKRFLLNYVGRRCKIKITGRKFEIYGYKLAHRPESVGGP